MGKTLIANVNLQSEEYQMLFNSDDGSYDLNGDPVSFDHGYIVSIPWYVSVMEAQKMIQRGGVFVLGRWHDCADNVYCDLSLWLPAIDLELYGRCQDAGEEAYYDCANDRSVYFNCEP